MIAASLATSCDIAVSKGCHQAITRAAQYHCRVRPENLKRRCCGNDLADRRHRRHATVLQLRRATADPVPIADVTRTADTDDGWHLSAELTDMTINSVPNMAATTFTKEAFLTACWPPWARPRISA
jgi:hypothetical protein